jgi:hypothetical protein
VSAWAAVLHDVASVGGTPAQVAARLGLPVPLVLAVLDHAERLGVVAVAGNGCGSGRPACPTGTEIPPACAGCSLALP